MVNVIKHTLQISAQQKNLAMILHPDVKISRFSNIIELKNPKGSKTEKSSLNTSIGSNSAETLTKRTNK